ncbi:helix-turn-helix transcriptional regulator [Bradyrhizobium rifense]|uniref:Helix-turn-helix transcriptional regulator n=1 Tax=Bradyrhizobium rifense TaxID=515499 RepID=A0A5D3KSD7_9BRAD|nr:helix-turn-helix transcriptional regulator [Bradyrhizobium rifense]TYL99640.1 helix-turn-helix transcriptional regulator [Bradyrhizobium rifense]
MLLHRPNPLDAPLYRRRVAEVSEIHRIVKALVEVRIAWKLTQNDVSSRMGIRRDHFARLETGVQPPVLATLEKWADALGYRLGLRPKNGE